jgi:hypothetical protein
MARIGAKRFGILGLRGSFQCGYLPCPMRHSCLFVSSRAGQGIEVWLERMSLMPRAEVRFAELLANLNNLHG